MPVARPLVPRHSKARRLAAWLIPACSLALAGWTNSDARATAAGMVDLSRAVVVVRSGELPPAEKAAAEVLVEEIERRTQIRLEVRDSAPSEAEAAERPVVELRTLAASDGRTVRPEGFRLTVDDGVSGPLRGPGRVEILGDDASGVLFGVGALLRNLDWAPKHAAGEAYVRVPSDLRLDTAPAYPIRGHQLGFRARANSWDAWDAAQFDRYIRELAVFGTNAIENIPFQDETSNSMMKLSRDEANREMSRICARYGLQHWVWTPAEFDLDDQAARDAMLDRHSALYRDCPRLDGVFIPGGDPGDNEPEALFEFGKDVAARLAPHHPKAKVWISLQGFDAMKTERFFKVLLERMPDWLGGLVEGPSSPPLASLRRRLPERYKLRLYPDITHNKLAQYEVPFWDQALARTLGREAINPRPVQYARIIDATAPFSDGFISYSDGVHDDVNKVIWSARFWDPARDVREVMTEYARFFFDPAIAEGAADGILALERNWHGPLATNGSVDATAARWVYLQRSRVRKTNLDENWRWLMNLLRVEYDGYIRHRLIRETALEREALAALASAGDAGADAAMDRAMEILARADERILPDTRDRIEDLCAALFHAIQLQTSVPKHQASGAERGAILDFVDIPLNDRWWLEDEFAKVRALPTEAEKLARLETIRTWEAPGPGSFYDDIGNVAANPHLVRGVQDPMDAESKLDPGPTHWWWENGMSRARLSWQVSMDWPKGLHYAGLDSKASYKVRSTGYGKALLRIDGESVAPTLDGRELGEFKEFPVPAAALEDGDLMLTWDRPTDEAHLNWRQQSRVCEVWLIRE